VTRGWSRRVARAFAVANLVPFAHCAQREHTDNRHTGSGDHCADEQPNAGRGCAVAGALHVDEGVADDTTGKSTEQNTHEGEHTRGGRGQRRQSTVAIGHRRNAIAPC